MSLPFLTTQTPTGQGNDFAPYCLDSLIEPLVDVSLDGVQWFMPDILPGGTVLAGIFDYAGDGTPGALLRSSSFPVPGTPHAYNVAPFSPLTRATGQRFYAAIWTPDRYVFSPSGSWTPVNNGHLLLPADDTGTPRRNGRFNFMPSPPLSYPNGSGGGLYYVGVTYTLSVPTVDRGVWSIGGLARRFQIGGAGRRWNIGPRDPQWRTP